MYNQLATQEEAEEIKLRLASIGGGVAETYVPEYGGPFIVPEDGPRKFLHFRFNNGADGFNVGLIRAFMQNSPFRWPVMLGTEVAAAAKRSVPETVTPPVTPANPRPTPVVLPAYDPIDFNRAVRDGFSSKPDIDQEPLGAVLTAAKGTFRKTAVPNGMMTLVYWSPVK